MKRTPLITQTNLDLRPGHEDEAPWDAVLKLLGQMQAILWDGHGKKWDARAQRCDHYASAPTPVAAMRAAIELRNRASTPRRRITE